MCSKVLLLGTLTKYEENFNNLNIQVAKNAIQIIGIVAEEYNLTSIDSLPVYDSLEDITENYDYIILLEEDSHYYNALKFIYKIDVPVIPVRVFNIFNFDFNKYKKLLVNTPSIISRHCWGGLLYHQLGLQFNTPFVNLFLLEKDFLKLTKRFDYYMNQELKYFKDGYDKTLKLKYPIAKLDDITLYFNHYPSFEIAKFRWDERKNRINYDNLFFETTCENKDVAIEFDSLNLNHKLCFTLEDVDSPHIINISKFVPQINEGQLGVTVNRTANGDLPLFDVMDLLLNYNFKPRMKY